MSSTDLVKAQGNGEVVPSLDELAATVNREHRLCLEDIESALSHAIRAGEALMEAKRFVPHGEWSRWVADNVRGDREKAWRYMRLAKYQDLIPPGLGQGDAIVYLRSVVPSGRSSTASTPVYEEALRLCKQGDMSHEEIGRLLGVHRSTVSHWVAGTRGGNRADKMRLARAKRARRALRQVERDKAMRRIGGKADEAYSLVRRAAQEVDRAMGQAANREQRQRFGAALMKLLEAEDEIGRACRLAGIHAPNNKS